ncbi:MAG: CocE/NonD family hydrolase [Dehalococcoidia bacterium]|nr:CocE/NonD family hydrolase [Dehalococcoidia bacterium]
MTLAEQSELVYAEQLLIPAVDGTPLSASLTRPGGAGPFPTVLTRTPYDRTNQAATAEEWARAGYAFVRQDVRGRFDSEGAFYPFRDDPTDGVSTIAWLAEQPWCNGSVVMTGASHVGTVQYLVAPRQPAALAAAMPEFAPASVYHYWWRHGGAFRLSFNVAWAILLARDNLRHYPDRLARLQEQQAQVWVTPEEMRRLEIKPFFRAWSPEQHAESPGDVFGTGWFADFMRERSFGPFWEAYDFRPQHQDFRVPMLHVGGWHDTFAQGTIDSFTGLSTAGHADQRLIMGPWRHVNWGQRDVGDLDFGDELLTVDPFQTRRAWFDRWLRDGPADGPPVLIFVMGQNAWREEETWPPPAAGEDAWYLHADGRLAREAPSGDREPCTYDYDPRNPVVTLGGPEWVNYPCGPFDHAPLEGRRDILTFESAPLEEDIEVTGRVSVRLFASSSAVDTDFTAKLLDVHTDGRAFNLCDGIIRARYRDSLSHPAPLTPGEPVELDIDLWSTSNLFRQGHRIRIDISSSNFPRFDVNPNTGDDSTGGPDTPREYVVARNTVYCDQDRPSHVKLPVVRRPLGR